MRLHVGMATWVQVTEEASGTGFLELELQALWATGCDAGSQIQVHKESKKWAANVWVA